MLLFITQCTGVAFCCNCVFSTNKYFSNQLHCRCYTSWRPPRCLKSQNKMRVVLQNWWTMTPLRCRWSAGVPKVASFVSLGSRHTSSSTASANMMPTLRLWWVRWVHALVTAFRRKLSVLLRIVCTLYQNWNNSHPIFLMNCQPVWPHLNLRIYWFNGEFMLMRIGHHSTTDHL